jgi:hypothetical protein
MPKHVMPQWNRSSVKWLGREIIRIFPEAFFRDLNDPYTHEKGFLRIGRVCFIYLWMGQALAHC